MGWVLASLLLAAIIWATYHCLLPALDLVRLVINLNNPSQKAQFIGRGLPIFQQAISALEELVTLNQTLQSQLSVGSLSLEAMVRNMSEGVLIVTPNGRISQANSALRMMFSMRDNFEGLPIMEALQVHEVQEAVNQALLKHARSEREITIIPDAFQTSYPSTYLLSATPVKDNNGRILGAVLIFRDLTQAKQLESVRREFVSNTSHELRTPLAIFQGYLETLLESDDMPWDEARPMLKKMKRHSDRLNNLVQDLLTLSRLESKRSPIKPAPLDPSAIILQIVADYEKNPLSKDRNIFCDLPDALPEISADPLRIEQVLYNLVDNACVYTHQGGTIHLSARHDPGTREIIFTVADNGIGIPTADIPHIFERFYRVDKARSREMGGTGLGLSIVKHIISAHEGRVWAESQLQVGTKIHFTIPCIQALPQVCAA